MDSARNNPISTPRKLRNRAGRGWSENSMSQLAMGGVGSQPARVGRGRMLARSQAWRGENGHNPNASRLQRVKRYQSTSIEKRDGDRSELLISNTSR